MAHYNLKNTAESHCISQGITTRFLNGFDLPPTGLPILLYFFCLIRTTGNTSSLLIHSPLPSLQVHCLHYLSAPFPQIFSSTYFYFSLRSKGQHLTPESLLNNSLYYTVGPVRDITKNPWFLLLIVNPNQLIMC